MPIRAALLCSDEKALEAVTQVFAEIDLSFEHFHDPALAIKRLSVQRFEAILVDCDNAPDASQVFEHLSKSSLNHNSISIAIVDGKSGVPTAFRLGASLVITKPVSLEQVRSTMRNAMSMHRKDSLEAKAHGIGATLVPAEPHVAQRIGDDPAKVVLRAPASSGLTTGVTTPPDSSVVADSEHTDSTGVSTTKPAPNVAAIQSPSSTSEPGPQIVRTTKPQPVAGKTLAADVIAPAGQVSDLDDPDALLEKQEIKITRKAAATHSNSGHDAAPRKSNSAFAAACALIVLGAGFYAAFTMQPEFHAAVMVQYDKVHVLIAGAAAHPQSAAVNVTTPVEPAQPSAEVTAPHSASSGDPSSDQVKEGFAEEEVASQQNGSEPADKAKLSAPFLLATSGAVKNTANVVNVNETTPLIVPDDVADEHVIHRVDAVYPEIARHKGVKGSVLLQASVNPDGTVATLKVLSGSALLAPAAIEAVKQWKYQTYRHDGKPSAFETQVTVEFPTAKPTTSKAPPAK